MATSAEVRAWAAANGHPELEGGRGKLGEAIWTEYAHAHPPVDNYGAGTSPGDFGAPDDDDDLGWVGAADDPDDAQLLAEANAAQQEDDARHASFTGHAGAPPEEERPQRPRAGKPRFTFGRKKDTGGGKKDDGKKKPRRTHKRVSIAPLIEEAYQEMAHAFAGIPPMARLLRAQAPLAGIVLEPAVKDTVADRILLQPAARHYEQAKVVTGLLGTPAALMAVLVTAPQPTGPQPLINETGNPLVDETGAPVMVMGYEPPSLQHQSAMVSLRFCVRAMADCAGDSLEKIAEHAAESEARDELVDKFVAYLLGMKYDPDGAAQRQSRQDREAGLHLAGMAMAAE